MGARSFAIAVALVVAAQPAVADEITEAQVIQAVRATDPEAAAARAAVEVATAREAEAGIYPNPQLGVERETLAGATEDTFSVAVPIELSGRRAARRSLARADAAEARARAARTGARAVEDALLLFYEGLAAEREVAIARDAAAVLDEAARVLTHRRGAGAASGYEQVRLELEAELARSAVAEAEAAAARARRELARRLDRASVTLKGALAPAPAAGTAKEAPSIALLGDVAAEAASAGAAAARAWVPTLLLSGGFRLGEADGSDERETGYQVGVAVELPLFSRGQDLRAEAQARGAQARAEQDAARRGDQRAAARAADALSSALAELARLERETGDRVERLARAAATGYREGELSLVELIDAARARSDVARRLLALAVAARRAEIAVRAARGELE